jgi:hypothetical protein
MKERIAELSAIIDRHNYLYYVQGNPEISDSDYDRMFRKLVELEEEYPEFADPNSPTKRVGAPIKNKFEAVTHPTPMRSVVAAQSLDQVDAFVCPQECVVQLKYDGAGVNLIYREGSLFKAISRGDGNQGFDITDNVRTIRNLPLHIDLLGTIEIRGEVWCPLSEMKRLQAAGAKVNSPVSIAVNSLRLGKSEKMSARHLRFTAFQAVGAQFIATTQIETIELLSDNGFFTPATVVVPSKSSASRRIAESLKSPDIPADGIIYKINDLTTCHALGYNAHAINWAMAWKFDEATVDTRITGLAQMATPSGLIVCSASIEPVVINFDTLSTVNLSSAEFDGHHVGESVTVRRVGTRIAQFVQSSGHAPAQSSHSCPECNSLLRVTHSECYCTNPDCPAKTGIAPDCCTGVTCYALFEDITAKGFSSTLGTVRSVAHSIGLKTIIWDKKQIRLYYNTPAELAIFGYTIGLVANRETTKYLNIVADLDRVIRSIYVSNVRFIAFDPQDFNANIEKIRRYNTGKLKNVYENMNHQTSLVVDEPRHFIRMFFHLALDKTVYPKGIPTPKFNYGINPVTNEPYPNHILVLSFLTVAGIAALFFYLIW